MKKRFAAALMLGCSLALHASADEPGRHPSYLHALSDLRAAQWHIDHRRGENPHIARAEGEIHDQISAAINDLQRAVREDDKQGQPRPPVDVPTREGQLHAVVDLLRKARDDIARPEDDPQARRLQQDGLAHVDAALYAAERAIGDIQRPGGAAPR